MKILQVGKFWPPHYGGIEAVHSGLHYWLLDNNVDSLSIVYDNNSLCENGVFKARYFLLFRKLPVSFSYLYFLFREIQKADVVHFHFPNPWVLFYFIMRSPIRKSSTKILVHWHSDLLINSLVDTLYNWLVRVFVLKRIDRIVVTSMTYALNSSVLKSVIGKTVDIPNFIFEPSVMCGPPKCPSKGDRVELISVGRNTFYKGHRFLIESLSFLPRNYYLTIVGKDVELLDVASELAERITLASSVSRKDLEKMYSRAHLFLLGSNTRAEAFGVVLAEAMTFGLPTVGFRIPGSGVLDVVVDGKTGFLVENENSYQLSKAILRIVEDDYTYNEFSENALVRGLLYSRENICPNFLALYTNILNA